jgi:predicted ArsR family transcriptional regulator
MAKRINVVLSEDVHRDLVRHVARGQRSRVLEEALRQYLGRQRRSAAARKLEALRTRAPVVSIDTVVDQLRRDRGRA